MCATPTTTPTPTATECPGGIWGWLRQMLSRNPAASSKRLLALMGAATLCASTLALTWCVVLQVWRHQAVDPQLVFALLGGYGATAALAGVAYRKPEAA